MIATLLRLLSCAIASMSAFVLAEVAQARVGKARQRAKSLSLEDMLRDRLLCFCLFAAVSGVLAVALAIEVLPVGLLCAAVLSERMPKALDRRQKADRRMRCEAQLDVMADILAMCMQSGLAFDSALELYCARFDGELSQQMQSASLRWKSGVTSRERALEGLASQLESPAVHRLSSTVVQAMRHGSPLAGMLTRLAQDLRDQRREEVQRKVEKAPVKMLVPTGVCILPAMLILVAGPALLQFLGSSF